MSASSHTGSGLHRRRPVEEIRRAASAKLMLTGPIGTAFIIPSRAERQMVREMVGRAIHRDLLRHSARQAERRDTRASTKRAQAARNFRGVFAYGARGAPISDRHDCDGLRRPPIIVRHLLNPSE